MAVGAERVLITSTASLHHKPPEHPESTDLATNSRVPHPENWCSRWLALGFEVVVCVPTNLAWFQMELPKSDTENSYHTDWT